MKEPEVTGRYHLMEALKRSVEKQAQNRLRGPNRKGRGRYQERMRQVQLRRRTDACSEASIGEAAKDTILGIPRLRPMLASTSKEPFDGSDWLFEVKWDGYRCLAYLRGGDVYLDSRNGKPLLSRFQSLSGMKEYLNCTSALLDGEIVAVDGGRVDFSYLRTNPRSVTFVAFDILHLDGRLLVDRPLAERKELLRGAMKWGGPVALSEFVEGQGKAMFEWAREQDLEGIMAKRKDSPYIPGMRTDNWLKVKNTHEGRFWVLGYLASPGRTIGSLVVAEKVEDGYAVWGECHRTEPPIRGYSTKRTRTRFL